MPSLPCCSRCLMQTRRSCVFRGSDLKRRSIGWEGTHLRRGLQGIHQVPPLLSSSWVCTGSGICGQLQVCLGWRQTLVYTASRKGARDSGWHEESLCFREREAAWERVTEERRRAELGEAVIHLRQLRVRSPLSTHAQVVLASQSEHFRAHMDLGLWHSL